jgi:hypothetical protein
MDVADLFVASTISNQPVARSIIVSSSRECVLAVVNKSELFSTERMNSTLIKPL